MSKSTRKVQSPEAVLERRLLAICTGLDRAIEAYNRAQPSTKYSIISYNMGEARGFLRLALEKAEMARCEVQNAEAMAGLAVATKAMVSHLRGGRRG